MSSKIDTIFDDILALLFVAPNREWIISALKLSPSLEAARVIFGLRAIAKTISTPEHPVNLDAGFSVNGWLAVLLTFVLARVFTEGARDPLLATRCDLRSAVVPARRHSSLRA